jgi:hypothetical protein
VTEVQLDGDAQLLLTQLGRKVTRLAAETSASKLAAQKLTDGLEGKMARVTALPKRSAVYVYISSAQRYFPSLK